MYDEEEENQPKIGFSNPGSSAPQSEKPLKERDIAYSDVQNTPFKRTTFIFFVVAMVTSIIALAYFFLPFFSAFLGIIAALFVFVIAAVCCVGTLFLALLSDDFRAWIGAMWTIPVWLFDVTEHLSVFAQYFGVVAGVALLFDIVSIVLCSKGLADKKGRFLTYLIFSIIMTILCAILVFIYIVGGFQIVVTH